jgi:hypothetical protein
MGNKPARIPPDTRDALDATGLPWRAEIGGNHVKIFLGQRFIGVSPLNGGSRGRHNDRGEKNLIAQIRRAARQHANGDRQ